MKYFVFKTEKYDQELKRHGEERAFEIFRSQREDDGNPHPVGDEFDFPGNYVKKYHNNLRSIFTYRDFIIENSHIRIYVALRLVPHGNRGGDYISNFVRNKKRDIFTGLANLNWENYKVKVTEIIHEMNKPVEKPKLSDCESKFIKVDNDDDEFSYGSLDFFIFESREWCDTVKSVDDNYLSCVRVAIKKILEKTYDPFEGISRESIPYHEQDILFTHSDDFEWHLLKIVPSGQEIDFNLEKTDILRGYPTKFILSDYTIPKWLKIEKDKDTNLILSDEEKKIVTKKRKQYPLFISGRAGSGKSTVIQYLFAEIIIRYVKNKGVENLLPPVYLSCSNKLIEKAKELGEGLLDKDNVFSEEITKRGLDFKTDIQPQLNGSYRVFKELVESCIKKHNPELYARKFDESKFVSFSKFKKLWKDHFKDSKEARTKYDPSVSWHVIRTYIKGWQSDKLLGRDDYEIVVPKSDRSRSVRDEIYRLVYDEVWIKWYAKKDYWDEQDLVRECLCPSDGSASYVSPQFSAIVCDEAQDFTRIEVDFILKSSCFSNRSISTIEEIKQLPFVFAGDEFQTLNPTGFSWDMLRAHFVNALFTEVGLGHKMDSSNLPEPIALNFNYRSTAEIVKFGNNIQLLRASRFQDQSSPQAIHSKQEQRAVFRLSPQKLQIWKLLAKNEIDLVVPAVEGQRPEDFVKETKDGEIILQSGITIFDTVQAKGLEYENVAVYGFDSLGKNQSLEISQLIKWLSQEHTIKDDDIDLKYQMSNTYVAVTRAKNKLFIMSDSQEPSFWNFADHSVEHEKVKQLTELMLDSVGAEWSKENIGFIEPGDESDISSENLGNWEETAHQREINADASSDDDMMEKASILYRNHGKTKDADRCAGKAAKIRGDYNKAISFFEKSEDFDLAVYALWTMYTDTKDSTITNRIASFSNKVQDSFAGHIVNICSVASQKVISVKEFISQLAELGLCLDSQEEKNFSLIPWQAIIDFMSKKLNIENITVSDFERIQNCKSTILALGLKVSDALLANMAYALQLYDKAVECWNNARLSSFPPEYYKSYIETTPYPDNLKYYEKAGFKAWKSEVINTFESHDVELDNDLEPHIAIIICEALYDEAQKEKFISYLPLMLSYSIVTKDETRFVRYIERAKSYGLDFNEDAVGALISLGFDKLSTWETPEIMYSDNNAKQWFSAIKNIKNLLNTTDEVFNKEDFKKSTTFWEKYCLNDNEVFRFLLHYEMGLRMEKRRTHVDAVIFYEWAKRQYSSKKMQIIQDIRWIACKRRQAGRDGVDSPHWNMASNKLAELGLNQDYDIPDLPSLSFEQWTELIKTILKIKNDIETQDGSKMVSNVSDSEVKAIEESKDDVPISTDIPIIEIDGYELVLRPKKNDIRIEYVEDLVSVSVGNGRIPKDNEDYFIEDSRLYRRDGEKNIATPFKIYTTNGKIYIAIEQQE